MVEDVKRIEKEQQILAFKKELGLGNIPYEDLHLYFVDDSSVTGVNSKKLITAREYVDRNIEQLEKSQGPVTNSILDAIDDFDEDGFPLLTNEPVLLLDESKLQREDPIENYIYLSVEVNDIPYTVIIAKNFDPVAQSTFVKNHWSFRGEKSRNMLTEHDLVFSFYQFVNFVGGMRNPAEKTDLAFDEFEDLSVMISKQLTTDFEGGAKINGF